MVLLSGDVLLLFNSLQIDFPGRGAAAVSFKENVEIGKNHGVFLAIYLPDEEFVNITKGVLLRKSQIVNISGDGLYTMTDGSVFQGRKRNISQHKQLRQALGLSKEQDEKAEKMVPLELLEKCSILNVY